MNGITMRVHVIETDGDWVLVCDSPFGRSSVPVPPPYAADELVTALHDLENANLRSAARMISRKSTSPELTAREFGQHLVETLFRGDAAILFDRCRNHARERGVPMRLLLETTGSNAARIPWEFASDPGTRDDYLALRVPVARSLSIAEPVAPLGVQPPLRVLGIQSRPSDLPELDYQAEQRRMAEAFDEVSSDLVQVTWLEGDRWRDIDDALRQGGWHVLHFVGHGGFSAELEAGYLELSDDEGKAKRVSSVDIGRAISRSRDLRLVVLNACDSATSGGSDVFASTAAKLMREGVPAVVAMQYEITDGAALTFSAAFYEAVAHNNPVDQAVTFAREHVRVSLGSLEWATPVLFLSSDETMIFDVKGEEAASPARAAAAAEGTEAAPEPAPLVPDTSAAERTQQIQRPVASETGKEWSSGLKDRLETTFRQWVATSKQAAQAPPPQAGSAAAHQVPPSQPVGARPPEPHPPPPVTRSSPRVDQPREQEQLPTEAGSAAQQRITLAVGPDGLVASATATGEIRVWSLVTHAWQARCRLPVGINAYVLAWHPSGRYLASADDDGTVAVWDLTTEARVRLLTPGGGNARGVCFSHSGRWLAVAAGDRTVQVYDVHGRQVRNVPLHASQTLPAGWARGARPLGPLTFDSADRGLVVASNDGRVTLVDVNGRAAFGWPHDTDVTALAVHGDRLATCTADGRLRVWDWSGKVLWRKDVPPADHLVWGADGQLVAASRDGTITRWDADGTHAHAAHLDASPVGVGCWAGAVVTGEAAGQLRVWRP